MNTSLFSPSWHLVKLLKPKLRDHFDIHRHYYRGELWYILQDHLSQRSFRFTPAANFIFTLMDGHRTMDEIWNIANSRLGDKAPIQDEIINLLGRLHAADALQSNITPDTKELLRRHKKNNQTRLTKKLINPLAIKIPLFDPDKFLEKTLPLARPLFSKFGAVVWLFFVVSSLILASLNWNELTHNISDRILTPQNLLIIWLIFPLIKAFHELGHAYATKLWGGEVHEIGIIFLVFIPVPYVDASSSTAFREKHRRMFVSAIGILVELFIAALALLLWVNIEPSITRSVAYNIILIASVSTLFFNGNPLLRFDGYYILSDWLEIQNMASRANNYIGYLCQYYLFKIKTLELPVSTIGERRWFVIYAIASFIYRMAIAFFIVLFVAGKFFFIGVLLAIWSMIMIVLLPFIKTLSYVFFSPKIATKRVRSITVTVGLLSLFVAILLWLPMPSWTLAEGIIWRPNNAVVRPNTDCFVQKIIMQPGSLVNPDDPLILCRNIELLAQTASLKSRLDELRLTYDAQMQENLVDAEITREEMITVQFDFDRIKKEVDELTIRSNTKGTFVVPFVQDLPGRFIAKGQEFAYTLNSELNTVRVAVMQDDIGMVRSNTRLVEVRMAENLSVLIKAYIDRYMPAATDELPSIALAKEGGGNIITVPSKNNDLSAYENFFLVDLKLADTLTNQRVGGRVFVRFDHGYEPLAIQWYRELRRLFLEKFNA